jgi:hypothetical protein
MRARCFDSGVMNVARFNKHILRTRVDIRLSTIPDLSPLSRSHARMAECIDVHIPITVSARRHYSARLHHIHA